MTFVIYRAETGGDNSFEAPKMDLKSLLLLDGVPPHLRMAAFASAGAFLGVGVYVAHISNALSYLSDDPKACVNCHIMAPQYASWKHSSHANVATCNDCHVPHDSAVRKYWFKANDGLRHSVLFTLRKERQVIRAIPESRHVIQENCIRCHSQTLEQATITVGHSFDRSCIECHREVPHGRVSSLSSTPNAAVPLPSPVTPKFFRQPNSRLESKP
jgi:cytochrome c nitrite reductase small subunit